MNDDDDYDKRTISVGICDRYSVTVNQVKAVTVKHSKQLDLFRSILMQGNTLLKNT